MPELLKAQEILDAVRTYLLAAFDISNLKELQQKNYRSVLQSLDAKVLLLTDATD